MPARSSTASARSRARAAPRSRRSWPSALRGGAYTDLLDFCQRVDATRVNKRVLEALIAVRCRWTGSRRNRATLMAQLPEAAKAAEQRLRDREAGQVSLFGEFAPGPVAAAARIELPVVADWPLMQRLNGERETLGYFLSGHPTDTCRDWLAQLSTCRIGQIDEVYRPVQGNPDDRRRNEQVITLAGHGRRAAPPRRADGLRAARGRGRADRGRVLPRGLPRVRAAPDPRPHAGGRGRADARRVQRQPAAARQARVGTRRGLRALRAPRATCASTASTATSAPRSSAASPRTGPGRRRCASSYGAARRQHRSRPRRGLARARDARRWWRRWPRCRASRRCSCSSRAPFPRHRRAPRPPEAPGTASHPPLAGASSAAGGAYRAQSALLQGRLCRSALCAR